MSALDDAIATHAAHPAASGFDPLTDCLGEQACPQPVPLRAGWENEPIEVPIPRLLGTAAFLLGLFSFLLLGGCASGMPAGFQAEEPAAARILASCPPLADVVRTDDDALKLRIAELEHWYIKCREEATRGKPAKAPDPSREWLRKGFV